LSASPVHIAAVLRRAFTAVVAWESKRLLAFAWRATPDTTAPDRWLARLWVAGLARGAVDVVCAAAAAAFAVADSAVSTARTRCVLGNALGVAYASAACATATLDLPVSIVHRSSARTIVVATASAIRKVERANASAATSGGAAIPCAKTVSMACVFSTAPPRCACATTVGCLRTVTRRCYARTAVVATASALKARVFAGWVSLESTAPLRAAFLRTATKWRRGLVKFAIHRRGYWKVLT